MLRCLWCAVLLSAVVPAGGQTVSQWVAPLMESVPLPSVPPPNVTDNYARVSFGGGFMIGIRSNGSMTAWGVNDRGQCNIPPDVVNPVTFDAGFDHTLALLPNGRVRAWGGNGNGQLNVPATLSNVVAVSAGVNYSMALRSNGTVVVWGGDPQYLLNPPPGLNQVKAISAGMYHALAVKQDGRVVTWGTGQFPPAQYPLFTNDLAVPPGISNIVAVAAGLEHSLALTADGRVIGWGDFAYGITNVPKSATNVVEIDLGTYVACARRADGTLIIWGNRTYTPPDLGAVRQAFVNGNFVWALLNQPVQRRLRPYVPNDFDGDRRTDFALFHPPTATWHIRKSSDGQYLNGGPFTWGPGNAVPVCGDYDGDGKTDLGLLDPATFTWYIRQSSNGLLLGGAGIPFGPGNSVPVPQDYDGDGKTDLAVFQNSSGKWFIRQSSDGQLLGGAGGASIGVGGQAPVLGDFDADGRADLGVWTEAAERAEVFLSTYRRRVALPAAGQESSGPAIRQAPVMADLDGDGISDLTTYIYKFSVSTAFALLPLPAGSWFSASINLIGPNKVGSASSWPVPGDYDGDRRTDAVAFNYRTGKRTVRYATGQRATIAWPPQRVSGLIPLDNQLVANRLTGAQP